MNTKLSLHQYLRLTLITLLFVALQAPTFAEQEAASPTVPLRLDVSLNKYTYAIGEPIVATLKITNTGAADIPGAWFVYDRDLFFDLARTGGRTAYMEVRCSKMQILNSIVKTLVPGASVTTTFDLLLGDVAERTRYFPRAQDIDFQNRHVESGLMTGGYNFIVRHSNWGRLNGKLDKSLRANAEFRVRGITPSEHKAMNLYRQRELASAGLWADGKWTSGLAAALTACNQLLEKHPDSLYAPYARYDIARILQVQGNFSQAAQAYSELLEKYPTFALRADALYFQASCLAHGNEKDKAREVFQTLTNDFPNHLLTPGNVNRDPAPRPGALEAELKS